jgi:hypothetical protein
METSEAPAPTPVVSRAGETALETRDRYDRELILKGREDPESVEIEPGLTLAEFQRRRDESQAEERRVEVERRRLQSRKLHRANDLLYTQPVEVVTDAASGTRIVATGEDAVIPATPTSSDVVVEPTIQPVAEEERQPPSRARMDEALHNKQERLSSDHIPTPE